MNEYFVELNKAKFKFLNHFLNYGKKCYWLLKNLLNWIFLKKLNNLYNWILLRNNWMKRILNQYFLFLSNKTFFSSLFAHFLGTFQIQPISMIPLNCLLNWINRVYFELTKSLNWILGEQYWIESFFGKIQTLNWIR